MKMLTLGVQQSDLPAEAIGHRNPTATDWCHPLDHRKEERIVARFLTESERGSSATLHLSAEDSERPPYSQIRIPALSRTVSPESVGAVSVQATTANSARRSPWQRWGGVKIVTGPVPEGSYASQSSGELPFICALSVSRNVLPACRHGRQAVTLSHLSLGFQPTASTRRRAASDSEPAARGLLGETHRQGGLRPFALPGPDA